MEAQLPEVSRGHRGTQGAAFGRRPTSRPSRWGGPLLLPEPWPGGRWMLREASWPHWPAHVLRCPPLDGAEEPWPNP